MERPDRVLVTLEMSWILTRDGADLFVGRARSAAIHLGDKILRKPMKFDRVPCVGEGIEATEGWVIEEVLLVWWSPDGNATLYLPAAGEWSTANGLRDYLDAGWTVAFGTS